MKNSADQQTCKNAIKNMPAIVSSKIKTFVFVRSADLWLAYCEFHRGNYKQALLYYESLDKVNKYATKNIKCVILKGVFIQPIYAACCYFYMGMYAEARDSVQRAPASPLKV